MMTKPEFPTSGLEKSIVYQEIVKYYTVECV